jgi:hypothetical protein
MLNGMLAAITDVAVCTLAHELVGHPYVDVTVSFLAAFFLVEPDIGAAFPLSHISVQRALP